MKLQFSVILLCCFIFSAAVFAQTNNAANIVSHGGGTVEVKQERCLTPEQSADIEQRIQESILSLQAEGKIAKPTSADLKKVTKFEWPLRQAAGFDQPDYYATINYVDLDPSPGIQDFNCNSRSYNGHNGIDISLWPYWWKMMEDDQVEVIAGAPGIIVFKQENNFDRNCSCIGNWNAVYVRHADGSIAWYGHLKKNSATSKGIGETVAIGEYLGAVGSSGCSSNPHIHLEIRDSDNNVIEPFQGTCNQSTTESWWQDQKPYQDPGLNLLMTHDVAPVLFDGYCASDENASFVTQFNPGDQIICAAYYRHHLTTDPTTYSIKDPNGVIASTWTHSSNGNYPISYWYWTYNHPTHGLQGTWTFEADYLGQTTIHEFSIGVNVPTYDYSELNIEIYPNPMNDFFQVIQESDVAFKYELININGQSVSQGVLNAGQTTVSMEQQAKGLYFLQLRNRQGKLIAREKIIKMN